MKTNHFKSPSSAGIVHT